MAVRTIPGAGAAAHAAAQRAPRLAIPATWPIGASAVSAVGVAVVATRLDYGTAGRTVALLASVAVLALLASRVAPGGRAGRTIAMLVLGLLGVAAGGGYGLAHLLVEGPSLAGLLALPALVAGAVLVVAGAASGLRAVPGWRRLAGIPVAFLVVQFVALPLLVAVGGAMQPRTALQAAPPPGFERVELQAEDGTVLRAWHSPTANGAIIVLLPGSGGTKGDVREHAAALQRHGYGVLALDARGHGESGGVGNAWGWRGDLDVRAAVNYALTRPEVDPARVGVVGLSMGAEQGITAAAADPRITAVVAEGASARTAGDVTWLSDAPTDLVDRVMYPILWDIVDLFTEGREPILLREAVATARAPILLIVGNDAAEVAAAPLLIGAAPDRVEPWSLPDTPHIAALALHPQEWETRVIDFLERHLR